MWKTRKINRIHKVSLGDFQGSMGIIDLYEGIACTQELRLERAQKDEAC